MGRSIEEILATADDPAYHRVATAKITLARQELRDEHARLEALLPTLTSDTIDSHPDRLATAERIAEIEAEMEASVIEFKFRSVGHKAWADLLRQHPPTREQKRELPQIDHNPETFPYEAIALSCIDPLMTVEQVRELDAKPFIDVQAWSTLWSKCLEANVVGALPKSAAAGLIRRLNGASATRHTNSVSHAASSSAA